MQAIGGRNAGLLEAGKEALHEGGDQGRLGRKVVVQRGVVDAYIAGHVTHAQTRETAGDDAVDGGDKNRRLAVDACAGLGSRLRQRRRHPERRLGAAPRPGSRRAP